MAKRTSSGAAGPMHNRLPAGSDRATFNAPRPHRRRTGRPAVGLTALLLALPVAPAQGMSMPVSTAAQTSRVALEPPGASPHITGGAPSRHNGRRQVPWRLSSTATFAATPRYAQTAAGDAATTSSGRSYAATLVANSVAGAAVGAIAAGAAFLIDDSNQEWNDVLPWAGLGALAGLGAGALQVAVQESRAERATWDSGRADPAATMRLSFVKRRF